jgi:hypothetical protein
MRRLRAVAIAPLIVAVAALAGPTAAATPTCHGKIATIVATGVNPTVTGTDGDDVIVGTDTSDTINAGGGNDTVCGRGGGDVINGEGGTDVLFGQDGDDGTFPSLFGLNGGPGNDKVYGGNGNDFMGETVTDDGDDTYAGNAGNDIIVDRIGANVAHGNAGSDAIAVTGKAYGDAGDDPTVQASDPPGGGPADAVAEGGSGSDGHAPSPIIPERVVVTGGTADGGSGNDHVVALGPGDKAYGGSGSDFVDGSDPDTQLLDCGSAYDTYATDGTDTVRRCEHHI